MRTGKAFLRDLEDAVARGSSARRVEMLRHVTDLFVAGAKAYSEEQLEVFDDVIERLARDIEVSARIELSRRLAPANQAPAKLARWLAFDDEIEVAEPMLSQATYLDEAVLFESAKSKSQEHLLAISRRNSLSEPLTDILVERGNRNVVHSVASNAGARFSESGFETLVERSDGDDDLIQTVGLRPDTPSHVLGALINKASSLVRRKLLEDNPNAGLQVRQVLRNVSTRMQARAHLTTRDYSAAERRLQMLEQAGLLDAAEVDACARAGSVEEVVVGLARLCDVPVKVVEHALLNERQELLMIIVKAGGLKWPTVKAILPMRAEGCGVSKADIDQAFAMYDQVQMATAQRVLRFHRARSTFQ